VKTFAYEARDRATNKIVKATVQADSESAAAHLLVQQGFVPLNIKLSGSENSILAKLTGRISTKDKVVFTRQLATLIGAGLPLSQSLHTTLEQTQNKQLQNMLQEITASVEGGKTLAQSFAKYPDVFDNVFLSLISAGEVSGTLDKALTRVAIQQEKDADTMSRIRGALTYPIIVLVVIFAVMGFMLFTVVPQVEKLYESLHKPLPVLTQIMVNTASFIEHFWWAVLIAVVVGGYFLVQYFRTDNGKKFADQFKLHAPFFGGMFRKMYMARFTRTGQTLLSTGVSMLDMMNITTTAVNNSVIGASIARAAEKVKGGKALSDALAPEDNITPLVPQMIRIGEQSGKIDEMMGKVAQVYEDELDEEIRTISTAIEPVLMVILAVVAGGMVGAILFPIYSLVNGLGAQQ
jgi:type IV pilus assembly protein PilC